MTTADERKAFEDALSADPTDWTTRLVYSDWLDEHDQPEEADRQRKWRAAHEWIESFAEEIGQSHDDLMSAADMWVESGDYTYDNTETYKEVDRDRWAIFWDKYEVIAGRGPTPDKYGDNRHSFFTCSC